VTFLAALLLATLPGFRVEKIGTANGFITSIVADSKGRIYYTTTVGDVVRFPENRVIAHVATEGVGNSGLLGMALRDDTTAIVHYTRPQQTHDVISSINLKTGEETLVHEFVCNILNPSSGISSEHHGGNPIVADDGSIFVGIGDGFTPFFAQNPDWNIGKIFRIHPDGRVEQYARGVRNPFDMVWDAKGQRLIVPDNGTSVDDEINIVPPGGADLGWPFAMPGSLAPVYTFPNTVAPTGFVQLRGETMLKGGYLLGAFVPRGIYYIADIDDPAPVAVTEGSTEPVVDITETADGTIYFAAVTSIYRLRVPQRGDCDGDGAVTWADLPALLAQQQGAVRSSWGCDVDGDGLISAYDVSLLKAVLSRRARPLH
jgi:hypothetical protein